jgi:hypothetical protein
MGVSHERERLGNEWEGETQALEVHRLHGIVYAFYDARQAPRHLSHRHGRLDTARDGVDPACGAGIRSSCGSRWRRISARRRCCPAGAPTNKSTDLSFFLGG